MTVDDLVRIGVTVSAGAGPVGARKVRDRWGGWTAAAEAAERERDFPRRARAAFRDAAARGERVRRDCARRGIRILLRGDADWPATLECLGDVPEVIFARGRSDGLRERGLALVGTRECSPRGAELAHRMAARLAEEGWTIVSGLARGIDAHAHRGALAAGGDTVAVLGCGPDVFFPEENRALQETIARDGLVVSEFAPGTQPRPGYFPRRNRILAALSEAVVVVESRLRSGALVTARHALDQGKEIFVVPGWPSSPHSAGPLALLRQGARPVRHAADLIEDLGGIPGGPAPEPAEVRALEALREGARTPAEVAEATGVSVADARERLARLELLGLHGPET